ncbi:MAG: GGDEF domain-containing protein, partial [Lysobacter sp.]
MPSQRLPDIRLGLIIAFGMLAVGAITPFAIYRFVQEQPLAGTVDLLIVLCITGVALYAWRAGDLDRAGWLMAVLTSTGCVVVGSLVGLPGVVWLYPILLSNFVLAPRRIAVVVSTIAIGVLAFNDALGGLANACSFVITALMVSVCAYIFSHQSDAQRRMLEAIATRDPLTGAINRRGLEREIHVAMQTARRDGTPVGLAVLDLDGFKRVNDLKGHEAGDAVLVQFARAVSERIRKSDNLFRLGGDEFALLVPGADADSLGRVMESIRQSVQDRL